MGTASWRGEAVSAVRPTSVRRAGGPPAARPGRPRSRPGRRAPRSARRGARPPASPGHRRSGHGTRTSPTRADSRTVRPASRPAPRPRPGQRLGEEAERAGPDGCQQLCRVAASGTPRPAGVGPLRERPPASSWDLSSTVRRRPRRRGGRAGSPGRSRRDGVHERVRRDRPVRGPQGDAEPRQQQAGAAVADQHDRAGREGGDLAGAGGDPAEGVRRLVVARRGPVRRREPRASRGSRAAAPRRPPG